MKINREKINLQMAKKQMTVATLANKYGVGRARMHVILKKEKVTPICAGRLATALQCDLIEIIDTN